MMKYWFEGRKVYIICHTTGSSECERKRWRERVSIITMKGKRERMTLAATENA
jgi:hypothetical protein